MTNFIIPDCDSTYINIWMSPSHHKLAIKREIAYSGKIGDTPELGTWEKEPGLLYYEKYLINRNRTLTTLDAHVVDVLGCNWLALGSNFEDKLKVLKDLDEELRNISQDELENVIRGELLGVGDGIALVKVKQTNHDQNESQEEVPTAPTPPLAVPIPIRPPSIEENRSSPTSEKRKPPKLAKGRYLPVVSRKKPPKLQPYAEFAGVPPLYAEMRVRHAADLDDSLVCKICPRPYQFNSKPALWKHLMRQHMGVTHNCRHCATTFTRPFNRNRHEKSAHFACPPCETKFGTKELLDAHNKNTHQEKTKKRMPEPGLCLSKKKAKGAKANVQGPGHKSSRSRTSTTGKPSQLKARRAKL